MRKFKIISKKITKYRVTINSMLVFVLLFQNIGMAQCTSDCNSNFGFNSYNVPSTIEYDNIVSTFHSTIIKESNNVFKIWGENAGNNGTAHLDTPLIINSTNFPALGSATVLKATGASFGMTIVQFMVLTTDGLYAWSREGVLLDNSLTLSTTFAKIATPTGGDVNTKLPLGISPTDVKAITASTYGSSGNGILVLLTCTGDVWVLSANTNIQGNGGAVGNATTWYRVKINSTTNLTNIIAVRVAGNAVFALDGNNQLWTWGTVTYLGNSTAATARNYATQMQSPTSAAVKMIGITYYTSGTGLVAPTYYVLMQNGNLYSLGENSRGQLGNNTTVSSVVWVQPLYGTVGSPPLNNIKWIAPNSNDPSVAAINVINVNANQYAFGNNNNSMLGQSILNPNLTRAVMSAGITTSDRILAVATGGHTSLAIKECSGNFGYVGHQVNGSMACASCSGTSTSITAYNFSLTSTINVCGAVAIPVINLSSTSAYVGDTVTVSPRPSNGTLTITSNPPGIATLVGNTISLTGAGTVTVQYNLLASCGGVGSVSEILKVFCSISSTMTGTVAGTKVGITTLDRNFYNPSYVWPDSVRGAVLAIDSKAKGFVLTRMSNPEVSITQPVEGMIVFDTDNNCIKLYAIVNGVGKWDCIVPACPD